MYYRRFKQIFCLLTASAILLIGCCSSENQISSSTTTNNKEKALPLSAVSFVNEATGGQIFLGMTKEEVDKVFPHLKEEGGDLNQGEQPNETVYAYDGNVFIFGKNELKRFAYAYSYDEGQKLKKKLNLTFNGKSKLDVSYMKYIKEYGDTAFVSLWPDDDHIPYENGIEKKLSGIDSLRYVFLKDGDTVKAMGVDDFKNLDRQTAKNMFVVDFNIDRNRSTVYKIEIIDYMYGTFEDWTYGSWTGVHSIV